MILSFIILLYIEIIEKINKKTGKCYEFQTTQTE